MASNAGLNQLRFLPGNVVIARCQERAVRIPYPLLRKKSNGVLPGHLWRRFEVGSGNCSVKSGGEVASGPKGNVSNLSSARIHLNQMCFPSILQHEIKAEDSRERKATNDTIRGERHFPIFHQTQHAGVTELVRLFDYLKMETCQHLA